VAVRRANNINQNFKGAKIMGKWTDNGGSWEEPEPGNHIARCIRVIELGTQRKEFQGKVDFKKQTLIVWELPTEKMEDGKPHTISKWYTASLNEKANLRRDLENWRGRPFTEAELEGFDQRNILEKPCLLNVIKNDKGKVVVGSVAAIPKGTTAPPQINETIFYDIDDHNETVWSKISEGIRKIILQSEERKQQEAQAGQAWKAVAAGATSTTEDDDTIPF